MRTTITLDDELIAKAMEMTGIKERAALIHEGLEVLIQRQAGRELALLGGTMPEANVPPRERPLPKDAILLRSGEQSPIEGRWISEDGRGSLMMAVGDVAPLVSGENAVWLFVPSLHKALAA